MKICLDANVLLEVVDRRQYVDEAANLLRSHASDELCITVLTVHLVMHFGRKSRRTIQELEYFLSDYEVLPMSRADTHWAFVNCRDDDFEDALQIAAAVRAGCEVFYTFDRVLYETYKDMRQIKVELVA